MAEVGSGLVDVAPKVGELSHGWLEVQQALEPLVHELQNVGHELRVRVDDDRKEVQHLGLAGASVARENDAHSRATAFVEHQQLERKVRRQDVSLLRDDANHAFTA